MHARSLHPRADMLARYMEATAEQRASLVAYGGLGTATPDGGGGYVVNPSVVMHDGTLVSMISAGLVAGGRAVLGSPFGSAVLVCPVPGGDPVTAAA